MPRISKHSKAYTRRSTPEATTGSMMSTRRFATRQNLPNDIILPPVNKGEARDLNQAGIDDFQGGLKPVKSEKGRGVGVYALGPELVTNGDFASDLSGWTPDTGWIWFQTALSNNPPADADLNQLVSTEAGKVYILEISVSNVTDGGVDGGIGALIDGKVVIPARTAVGQYYGQYVATGSSASLDIRGIKDNQQFLNYVSLRERL